MRLEALSPCVHLAMRSWIDPPCHMADRVIFDYELVYCESGRASYTVEGETFVCGPGDIILFRPNQRHSLTVIDAAGVFSQPHVHFDLQFAPDSHRVYVNFKNRDALSPADQLTLEVARMVREDFLQQNAFADVDSFSSYDRQEKLLAMVLRYDRLCREAISKGAPVAKLFAVPSREKIGRAKSVPAEEYQQVYQQISAEMEQEITAIAEEGGEDA